MPERVKVDGGDAAAGKIFLKNILIPARLHGDILLSCKKIGILFRHSFQRSQKQAGERGQEESLSGRLPIWVYPHAAPFFYRRDGAGSLEF